MSNLFDSNLFACRRSFQQLEKKNYEFVMSHAEDCKACFNNLLKLKIEKAEKLLNNKIELDSYSCINELVIEENLGHDGQLKYLSTKALNEYKRHVSQIQSIGQYITKLRKGFAYKIKISAQDKEKTAILLIELHQRYTWLNRQLVYLRLDQLKP